MNNNIEQADKVALRALVRTLYDFQRLRIMVGNRLCINFRVQLGQEPGERTDELPEDAQKLLVQLKEEYKLLADGLTRADPKRWRKMLEKHAGIISTPYELVLTERYINLEETEQRLGQEIAALVKEFDIWRQFLDGVRGVGPVIAAILISELDPYKARHVSSFWRYAGLDVAGDGLGRSRRKEHLERRPYTDKDGEESERDSITFNPFLRTKLIGVLGSSFLKAGGHYRTIYDDYKHRWESHPKYGLEAELRKDAGATKLHRHNAAVRYCVKIFLADLWEKWRLIEGLPIRADYAEAKLGLKHGSGDVHHLRAM